MSNFVEIWNYFFQLAGSAACWLVSLLLLAGLIFFFRWRRRLVRKQAQMAVADAVCQRCGYKLRGLKLPRCPECGTLRGFEVPMEKLGLNEQELQELYRQRQRQKEQARNAEFSDESNKSSE